ncbi:MAG: hypothetical protein RR251_07600 [Hydrogenoanaerobacterium sp.]
MKKLFATIIAVGMAAMLSITAFAAEPAAKYSTPADIVAGLTGRTVESVIAERAESGKTYGTIADNAGKLTEFKTESLKLKKDILAEQVEKGILTQEEYNSIIAAIEANMAICDGKGSGYGRGGLGCGGSRGHGCGRGVGRGAGMGGMRLQNGSCYVNN